MLVPLGASPTDDIGFEAADEILAADSTAYLVPAIAAPTAEAAAG
jgi:hypothetical protein